MIRNLQQKNQVEQFKIDLMESIIRILKLQSTNSLPIIILYHLLSYVSNSSILFINDPLQPKQANQFYKIFILQFISGLIGVDQRTIFIIFIVILTLITILVLLNLSKNPFKFTISWLSFAMPLVRIIIIPVCYYSIDNFFWLITDSNNDLSLHILRLVLLIETIIVMFFTILYNFFSIRPLRYNNYLWNFENKKHFFYFLFIFGRAIIFYLDKPSIILLAISIIIQLQLHQIPSPYLNPKIVIIIKCRYNLQLIASISVILQLIFDNKSLAFLLLCICSALCLICCVLEYLAEQQQSQQIPICCVENCFRLYAYFIQFKDQTKNTNEDLMRKISAHHLVCNQKQCIFKEINQDGSSKISNEDLQQKISKYFKSFRYKSPTIELLYQIWKIQLNESITLSHNLREFDTTNKYIVQYVLGPQDLGKKNESYNTSNSKLSNDSLNFKWKFYQQINTAVEQFQKMGEILLKPIPQLNSTIDIVIGVHVEIQNLSRLFQQMITKKQVNYLCIQLYLKFFGCFLNKNKLSTQILDRLKRLKILVDTEQLEQNPLPCFLVEAQSKTIEKANSQALKFIKAHRFELKNKVFSEMVIPALNPKELYDYQIQSQKKQQIPLFFKIKTSKQQYNLCRNIKLKTLQINNKNFYQITLNKNNHGSNVIQLLIDDNQHLVASTNKRVFIMFRQGKIQFQIEQLFIDKIKQNLQNISYGKIGRIQFGQRSLVSGMLIQRYCPYNSMKLICLNLIKKVSQVRNNKRSSNISLNRLYNHYDFAFCYIIDQEQKVILQGTQNISNTQQKSFQYNISIGTLKQKSTSQHIQTVLQGPKRYGLGIKVYRLYQEQLYNIDLEDRQKYQIQFHSLLQQNASSSTSCTVKTNQNCLITMLILLALAVTGCSIFLTIKISNQITLIQSEQVKILQTQQFNLNFNRVMAILRDVSNGIFALLKRDYRNYVLDSYMQLQKIDSSNFLNQTVYQGVYDDQQYQGTLTELIQVSLTHVFEFMQINKIQIIQKVHKFSLGYLGPILHQQKQLMKTKLFYSFDGLLHYCLICCITIGSGSILYFILFMLMTHTYKINLNTFLEPLLLKSQRQIKGILEKTQKFKNIISNLYKNYEVDPDSIEEKKNNQKIRQKPKKTAFGFSTILREFIMCGLVILAIICVAIVLYITVDKQIQKIIKQSKEGQAILQSYQGLSQLTNQLGHYKILDVQKINLLSKQLEIIEMDNLNYEFSKQLSNQITTVFFTDSCSYLVNSSIINKKWCGQSFQGFTLTNPFKISLSLFFRRMIYFCYTNLTQTYSSTGIYSQPFKQLFKYFSYKITIQTQNNISQVRTSFLAISILLNILCCFLVLIFVVAVPCFKRKTNLISKGLICLIDNQNMKNNILQVQQKKQQHKKNVKQLSEQSQAFINTHNATDIIIQV